MKDKICIGYEMIEPLKECLRHQSLNLIHRIDIEEVILPLVFWLVYEGYLSEDNEHCHDNLYEHIYEHIGEAYKLNYSQIQDIVDIVANNTHKYNKTYIKSFKEVFDLIKENHFDPAELSFHYDNCSLVVIIHKPIKEELLIYGSENSQPLA